MSKIGRNEPCPCGSGRKYKHCCMKKDQLAAASALDLNTDPGPYEPGPDPAGYPPAEYPDVPLDPRAMEREEWIVAQLMAGQNFKTDKQHRQFLAGILNSPELPKFEPKTPAEEAQLMMYDAFAAEGKRRVELAEAALKISPDCADAYVLLGDERAATATEAADLFTAGIAAAERALGPDVLTRYEGKFWTALETRPYLRARYGLARAYAALARHDDAVAECQELLEIDPLDSQQASFLLLNELLHAGRNEEALTLAEQYPDDMTTNWLFNSALVKFRVYGDDIFPRYALRLGMEANPIVIPYLLGEKKPPKHPSFADTDKLLEQVDALLYTAEMQRAWEETPGALDWAKHMLHLPAPEEGETPAKQSNGPRLFLNPDPGFYDARRCPECHEKTRRREEYFVMVIEPSYFGVSKQHSRYCETCDILTINEEDAAAAAGRMIAQQDPDGTIKPYLPLGILSEDDMRDQDPHHLDATWAIEHVQGFKDRISPEQWEELDTSGGTFDNLQDHAAISPLILPGR